MILWRANWQIVSRIGAYVSLASGIGMIIAFWLCVPARASLGLSIFEASLSGALLSIFPIIYMAFPAVLLILFRKAGKCVPK
ncbi:MAG: hypothetical protein PHI58_00605 [Candidatus Omnitrophica bacterium]|nr:hypothetical protein [Candidatus Omnitrophota bacterium]